MAPMTTPESPRELLARAQAWLGGAATYARAHGSFVFAVVLVALGLWIFGGTILDILSAAGAQAGLLFMGAVALVLTGLFLWLFVGEPKESIDEMVRFSYLFTLLAIGGSVLPFFAFQYLADLEQAMRKSPIGFVSGCQVVGGDEAPEIPKEIACGSSSQWVLNIGGIVRPVASEPTGPPVPAATSELQPVGAGLPANEVYEIEGGLVVPLYFIVLALMGASVGMARRVPEYQRRFSAYKDVADLAQLTPEQVKALSEAVDSGAEKAMSPHRVREHLVFQIMQVVSAPLIAIVAYHLIEPGDVSVTVAVGFAAGFGAEPILMLIRRIATAVAPPSAEST